MDSSACSRDRPARRRVGRRRSESDPGNRRREARARQHRRTRNRKQRRRPHRSRRPQAASARRPCERQRNAAQGRHHQGVTPPRSRARAPDARARDGGEASRTRATDRERPQRPHAPYDRSRPRLAPRRPREGRDRRVRDRVRARRPRRGRVHARAAIGHGAGRGTRLERLAARRLARRTADRDHRAQRRDPATADAGTGGRADGPNRREQHVHACLDPVGRQGRRGRTRSRRRVP